jgi:hypothetical protein
VEHSTGAGGKQAAGPKLWIAAVDVGFQHAIFEREERSSSLPVPLLAEN